MRAFFDALQDVEMVTQCRYQAPNTLHAAITTAQMVDATVGGAEPVHVQRMYVLELSEKIDDTPLTLHAIIKAFHTALAPLLRTFAAPTTSMPKGPNKELRGDRKQMKTLQEGLRKQAVDTDRRCSQMVDQVAHVAGSMERIEGLLRQAQTDPGTWSGSALAGRLSSSPRRPEGRGSATDASNQITSLGVPNDQQGRTQLDAGERTMVAEAARADRPSDVRARTLVHFGGQTTKMREVCMDVQIQGVTRTYLLDTG